MRLWKRVGMGDPMAQLSLGHEYMNGSCGLAKDVAEAARLFRLAAEQGLASAQYNLGKCCLNGDGVAKNAQEGERWLTLAALDGHVNAKRTLATILQAPEKVLHETDITLEAARAKILRETEFALDARTNTGLRPPSVQRHRARAATPLSSSKRRAKDARGRASAGEAQRGVAAEGAAKRGQHLSKEAGEQVHAAAEAARREEDLEVYLAQWRAEEGAPTPKSAEEGESVRKMDVGREEELPTVEMAWLEEETEEEVRLEAELKALQAERRRLEDVAAASRNADEAAQKKAEENVSAAKAKADAAVCPCMAG